MGKLIFWFLVIVGVLLAARLLARQASKAAGGTPAPAAPLKGKPATPEAMVRCAHCGIHMPRSEALLIDGQTWCSKEHAKLGVRP